MAAIAAGLGGGLVSGLFGMEGGKAQANAEKYAAQLSAQEADKALNFQQNEFNTTQANEAPWLSAGKGALGNLQAILAEPGQGWDKTFTAPTAAEAAQNPGYPFSLEQGEGALQNSAAAKGSLFSGNTEEALSKYAENAASSNYGDVYNRAFNEYLQSYGQYNNQLNRLSALSGTGQTTANVLGAQGQAAANNVGNIDLTTGAQQGQDIANAAAATASGYNALGNAFGSTGSNVMNLMMLQKLLGSGGGGGFPGLNGDTALGAYG